MIELGVVVDTDTVFGLAAFITTPLLLIVSGIAAWKVQDAARWKSAAEAERTERTAMREGIQIRDERIRTTNEWAAAVEARYAEREALIAALNERVNAQAEHIRQRDAQIAQLLERTPEKLWEAVIAHSEEARAQWSMTGESQRESVERAFAKLDEILAGIRRIEGELSSE